MKKICDECKAVFSSVEANCPECMPQGYDEAETRTGGEYEQLPSGAYICIIKKAKEVTSKTGKQMLEVNGITPPEDKLLKTSAPSYPPTTPSYSSAPKFEEINTEDDLPF